MVTVNAMGDNCPIPVIKTKKAMQALTGPEKIEVLVDNEIAVQNVTKMASSAGGQVSSEKLGDAEFKITIQMEGAPAGEETEAAVCAPDARDNTVVVVSSDRMGIGDHDLRNLPGLLWIEGQAGGRFCDEYVQHCRDNGESRKDYQTIEVMVLWEADSDQTVRK